MRNRHTPVSAWVLLTLGGAFFDAATSMANPTLAAPVCALTPANLGHVESLPQAAATMLCSSRLRQLLIIGRRPGVNENEQLASALVEAALKQRPVRLGLELPVSEQEAIQSYLHSSGTDQDKAKLMQGAFWKTRDGRASKALLGLIDHVLQLRATGADIDVFLMEPADTVATAQAMPANSPLHAHEADMAAAIRAQLNGEDSRLLVVALMADFHARYANRIGADKLKGAPLPSSTAEQLTAYRPYIVYPSAVHESAWSCTAPNDCGAHTHDSAAADDEALPQLAYVLRTDKGVTLVSLRLATMTASVPAHPQAAKHAAVAPKHP